MDGESFLPYVFWTDGPSASSAALGKFHALRFPSLVKLCSLLNSGKLPLGRLRLVIGAPPLLSYSLLGVNLLLDVDVRERSVYS